MRIPQKNAESIDQSASKIIAFIIRQSFAMRSSIDLYFRQSNGAREKVQSIAGRCGGARTQTRERYYAE
jgi:hypothetical protein